jgi:hypothetical protein
MKLGYDLEEANMEIRPIPLCLDVEAAVPVEALMMPQEPEVEDLSEDSDSQG